MINIIKTEATDHYEEVARLHSQNITEGFLSTLGNSFLAKLYRGISNSSACGVFIAVENENVLGFIAYTCDVSNCYKKVLKNNLFTLGLAVMPSLVKPVIVKKIIETLCYPLRHRKKPVDKENNHEYPQSRAELLAMAVTNDARGKGIGKLLVHAIEKEMISSEISGYFVVTHAIDETSNKFYSKCGFNAIREFSNHGKPMREYFKHI